MKTKLNPLELAKLYYIMFNISESGTEKQEELYKIINPILGDNDQPNSGKWIPDEEGAPLNASDKVYEAYYSWFKVENAKTFFSIPFLNNEAPIPTWDEIYNLIKD